MIRRAFRYRTELVSWSRSLDREWDAEEAELISENLLGGRPCFQAAVVD